MHSAGTPCIYVLRIYRRGVYTLHIRLCICRERGIYPAYTVCVYAGRGVYTPPSTPPTPLVLTPTNKITKNITPANIILSKYSKGITDINTSNLVDQSIVNKYKSEQKNTSISNKQLRFFLRITISKLNL